MLAAIAASVWWLGQRGEDLNEAQSREIAESSAAIAGNGAKEAAPSVEAMINAEAASHVYSHRGSEGDNEHTFAAYDAAI